MLFLAILFFNFLSIIKSEKKHFVKPFLFISENRDCLYIYILIHLVMAKSYTRSTSFGQVVGLSHISPHILNWSYGIKPDNTHFALPDTYSTILFSSPVSSLILSLRAPKTGSYFWILSVSFDTNKYVRREAPVLYLVHQIKLCKKLLSCLKTKMVMSCFS